ANVSGKFQEIVPAIPGEGLAWDMVGGVLKVVKDISSVDTAADAGMQVGPIPFSDQIAVNMNNQQSTGRISLLNAAGKVLISEEIRGEATVSLNTSSLAAGMYFLRVEENNKVVSTDKMIKR